MGAHKGGQQQQQLQSPLIPPTGKLVILVLPVLPVLPVSQTGGSIHSEAHVKHLRSGEPDLNHRTPTIAEQRRTRGDQAPGAAKGRQVPVRVKPAAKV